MARLRMLPLSFTPLRLLLFPLLAFITAAILALLFWFGPLPDYILYLRIDLGNAFFLGGLLLSLAWGGAALWAEHTRQATRKHLAAVSADERWRFLRRLDHELKNPLTAIRAGLANLAEASSEKIRQEALSSVEAQTLRLSRLSADLRKLAELETRPLECSPVEVNEMLHEAFALAQDQEAARQRQLKLTLPQAPWPLPSIQGDQDLLFLAVHNLLDNALKFTAPGATIELRAYEDGASVVVEVADTGTGIPAEELEHVWEELYRGRGARGIPGNGLGLALVRAIILRHGGQVRLRSRSGQGTVVTLRLPSA